MTTGDYLQGFYLGTRDALSEKDRSSITITIDEVSPRTLGMMIALYERVVGLYASLVNINAYHQPGVEAGKKAATGVINLLGKLKAELANNSGTPEQLAQRVDGCPELSFKILEHLAANGSLSKETREPWFESIYSTK